MIQRSPPSLYRLHILRLFTATLLTAQLGAAADPEAPYAEDWDSLARHEPAPEWFQDAKFGIYFHWGVYSVPAFRNEWYPYSMNRPGTEEFKHHLRTYGHPREVGYHTLVKDFTAEHFDPDDWAQLFQDAGARFAGPVAEHHDGFAMWDSAATPWNAADKGPKRDILGDLFQSLESRGLKTIATFHHARNLQRYPSIPAPENANEVSEADGGNPQRQPLRQLAGMAHRIRRSGTSPPVRKYARRGVATRNLERQAPRSHRPVPARHHLVRQLAGPDSGSVSPEPSAPIISMPPSDGTRMWSLFVSSRTSPRLHRQ